MTVVDQIGGTLSGTGLTVWMWQLKKQLAHDGNLHTVDAAVTADITDRVAVLWNDAAQSYYGDDLSGFIKTTLSKTSDQVKSIYASAAAQTASEVGLV